MIAFATRRGAFESIASAISVVISPMWYRVFGLSEREPSPADLAEHLHATGLSFEPHFAGDDLGWTRGELKLPGNGTPVLLQRFLASEDGLRADLNSHAAILETCDYSPNNTRLMGHVIATKQMFVLRKPIDVADEVALEKLLEESCRFLAFGTDGIYQIDGTGWFSATGEMLLQEY